MTPMPLESRFRQATDVRTVAEQCAKAFAGILPGTRWSLLEVANALPARDGFALQYRVPLADGTVGHIGCFLPSDALNRPPWTHEPGTAWLPSPGLALAVPAADPRLRNLGLVLTPAWHRDLARTLGWTGVPDGPPVVLAYRLGKRCVLRCEAGRDSAVVKLLRPNRLEDLVAAHRRTAKGLGPEVLQADAKTGALVMAEIIGTSLHDVAGPAARSGQAAAGSLLRSFHTPHESGSHQRTAADELDQLRAWTDAASTVFPELETSWTGRLAHLAKTIPRAESTPVRLHRDFFDKQVVLTGRGAVLLDLDTVAAGDPALDLGNHLAHVRLRSRQDPIGSGDAAGLTASFLSGYGPSPHLRERAGWWCAASLLRLSIIYTLRPRWRNLTFKLLEETDSCLQLWQRAS